MIHEAIRRVLATALCVLLLSGGVAAAVVKLDSLRVGSRTYRGVTVLGATATDLFFTHAEGVANVKLRLLSPELQKRFHYDPDEAAETEKKQEEDALAYHDTLGSNIMAQVVRAAEASAKAAITSEESLADPISKVSPLGKPAPELEAEKWLSEKPESAGKFLLVYFWAPWSVPCRKNIPEVNALQKKFAEKLTVVGMTSESEADVLAAEGTKLEFSSAIDTQARLSNALGVTSVPCALLVDPKGVALFLGHPAALTEKKLQALLAKSAE
jgi:cytochrome c biogenesis protein CcmG, thiol:disulfide interchange protein DsbE